MNIDTPFKANYEIQSAYEWPGSGASVLYFPPQDDKGRIYETTLAFKRSGTSGWYGTFAARSKHEGGLTIACTMPDPDSVCVSCLGTGYIVNTCEPSEWEEVNLYPILQIFPVANRELLLLSSFTKIQAYGPNGKIWTSERLASDQLRITAADGERIKCTGWNAAENSDFIFEVDLLSGLARKN